MMSKLTFRNNIIKMRTIMKAYQADLEALGP